MKKSRRPIALALTMLAALALTPAITPSTADTDPYKVDSIIPPGKECEWDYLFCRALGGDPFGCWIEYKICEMGPLPY